MLASDAAAGTPVAIEVLIAAIKATAVGPTDPGLLAGVLIEGLAQVIGTIPTERRRDYGIAAVQLMIGRVRSVGGG